ncbi:MAG: hypothetical protein H7210_01950 [Pyrinomonadaceae bacterium]|nr:hypothetical protein [Phycisphaerales bacterium]
MKAAQGSVDRSSSPSKGHVNLDGPGAGSRRRRGQGTAEGLGVPMPAPPPDPAGLPVSITFFLTAQQRSTVIKRLGGVSGDRTRALLKVLGIRPASSVCVIYKGTQA